MSGIQGGVLWGLVRAVIRVLWLLREARYSECGMLRVARVDRVFRVRCIDGAPPHTESRGRAHSKTQCASSTCVGGCLQNVNTHTRALRTQPHTTRTHRTCDKRTESGDDATTKDETEAHRAWGEWRVERHPGKEPHAQSRRGRPNPPRPHSCKHTTLVLKIFTPFPQRFSSKTRCPTKHQSN